MTMFVRHLPVVFRRMASTHVWPMPHATLPVAVDWRATLPLERIGTALGDAAMRAHLTGEPHLFTPAFAKGTPKWAKREFRDFVQEMDLAAGSKLGVSIAYNTAAGQPQVLVQRLCQGETPMAEWQPWRS